MYWLFRGADGSAHPYTTAFMENNFTVNGLLPNNTRQAETAVHTGALDHRAGYDENFLHKKLPLPTLGAGMQKDLPIVQKEAGSHGNRVLDYTHFSVLYNKTQKLPFYTAVNIDGTTPPDGDGA